MVNCENSKEEIVLACGRRAFPSHLGRPRWSCTMQDLTLAVPRACKNTRRINYNSGKRMSQGWNSYLVPPYPKARTARSSERHSDDSQRDHRAIDAKGKTSLSLFLFWFYQIGNHLIISALT